MAKSVVKQRREQGAVCPRCQSPDYKMSPSDVFADGKPNFTCGFCGNSWQYGYDGGIYAKLALQPPPPLTNRCSGRENIDSSARLNSIDAITKNR